MSMFRRKAELEEIDQFIARRGAQQCRAAFAGTVNGALPLEEERDRIAALKVEPSRSRPKALAIIRRQMWRR